MYDDGLFSSKNSPMYLFFACAIFWILKFFHFLILVESYFTFLHLKSYQLELRLLTT